MGANFVYEMLSLLVYLLSLRPRASLFQELNLRRFPGVCYHVYGPSGGLFGGSIYLSLRNIKHLCNQKSDHIDNRFWLKSEEARIKTIEGTPTTLEEERHYVARVRAEEWVWERMRIIKQRDEGNRSVHGGNGSRNNWMAPVFVYQPILPVLSNCWKADASVLLC